MLINNININNFSAELLDRKISTKTINSITSWSPKSAMGILLNQYSDFKEIKLQFLIQANTEDQAFKQISKLTQALEKSIIRFDDIELDFNCYLSGKTVPERLINGSFKIEYILKNDIAKDQEVSIEFNIQPIEAKRVNIKYVQSRAQLLGHYLNAFDNNDIYTSLGSTTLYYDYNAMVQAAETAEDWNHFFLSFGVDLNLYKPILNNTTNGFIFTELTFNAVTAIDYMNNHNELTVYYNLFHKDGIADLPTNTYYPNLTLKTGTNNYQFFDLNIGANENLNNLSIKIDAKLTDNALITPTSHGINRACLFGTFAQSDYTGWYLACDNTSLSDPPKWFYYIYTGNSDNIFVQNDNSESNEPSGINGFINKNNNLDIYKQGKLLYRNISADKILSNNLTLFKGYYPSIGLLNGSDLEMSRCTIMKNNIIQRDLIPIDGAGVKNGFVNTYGIGLYDINKMEFISASFNEGEESLLPHFLPLPTVNVNYPRV